MGVGTDMGTEAYRWLARFRTSENYNCIWRLIGEAKIGKACTDPGPEVWKRSEVPMACCFRERGTDNLLATDHRRNNEISSELLLKTGGQHRDGLHRPRTQTSGVECF